MRKYATFLEALNAAVKGRLLQDEIDGLVKIAKAADEYIREHDNPAPDYNMRKTRRDDLRKAINEFHDSVKH